MHRFYSAEDLRRHMRTHTKEQPFACQSCKRRFTLKHSMVRHIAKKHGGAATAAGQNDHQQLLYGEPARSRSPTPPPQQHNKHHQHRHNRPSSSSYDDYGDDGHHRHRSAAADTGLIGTLLGIRDSTVIDQMLQTKSPEDAAKMLGIKNND